jgi:hypothetical protein
MSSQRSTAWDWGCKRRRSSRRGRSPAASPASRACHFQGVRPAVGLRRRGSPARSPGLESARRPAPAQSSSSPAALALVAHRPLSTMMPCAKVASGYGRCPATRKTPLFWQLVGCAGNSRAKEGVDHRAVSVEDDAQRKAGCRGGHVGGRGDHTRLVDLLVGYREVGAARPRCSRRSRPHSVSLYR